MTAIVCLHGIMGCPRQFDFLQERLGDDCRIITPLLPGHGGDAAAFARSSMAEWEKAAEEAVSDACREHDRVILLGHSMGALLLAETARRFPQVQGVVLVAMPLRFRYMPYAAWNVLKVACTSAPCKARELCGVLPRPLWACLGWIPRYLELFKKARRVKALLPELSVPVHCFYFQKDELCAPSSVKDLPDHFSVEMCKKSRHSEWSEEICGQIIETICKLL